MNSSIVPTSTVQQPCTSRMMGHDWRNWDAVYWEPKVAPDSSVALPCKA